MARTYMTREQEIEDVILQLQELNIQQTNLLTRLDRLSGRAARAQPNRNAAAPPVTPPPAARADRPQAPREFAIGDHVRIRNPGLLQATQGTIIKIGTSRITVQARNGTKILRAPKNLIFEDE